MMAAGVHRSSQLVIYIASIATYEQSSNRERRKENNALMFGKPDVGNPIAALHINALPITSKFG